MPAVLLYKEKSITMANQEEKNTANENKEQGNAGADNNQNTGNETLSTDNGHKKDPVHNTGDERMMIDESGAEVKPDDQV
jgi:hypothetical protein